MLYALWALCLLILLYLELNSLMEHTIIGAEQQKKLLTEYGHMIRMIISSVIRILHRAINVQMITYVVHLLI